MGHQAALSFVDVDQVGDDSLALVAMTRSTSKAITSSPSPRSPPSSASVGRPSIATSTSRPTRRPHRRAGLVAMTT